MLHRSIVSFFILVTSVIAEDAEHRLSPGEYYNQVYLDELTDGTHVLAEGVTIYGGESEHFVTLPEFALHSARHRDPENGVGYPDTSVLVTQELDNEEIYPLQLRDAKDLSLSGVAVIGLQSPKLPWRVVKEMWDGDALLAKHCEGSLTVKDVYFRNTEDGIGPGEGLDHWTLERAWMEDIRDDAIENDDLVPGAVINCLIDGSFVFLSQRAPDGRVAELTTVIRDSLIRISAQPHDGAEGKPWRDRFIVTGEDGIGRAPGMFFKWANSSGRVEMIDCIIHMSAISINGEDDMRFPPGNYENVTLVWTGDEPYPVPLPSGVTLTNDQGIWDEARSTWIKSLPESHPGLQHGRR
ncbi:MAG: hypothetical protein P1U58_17380 [Verrucomicrobiales bacterium]|nr:hypothetical protein [Verrucomicrobiales bacterium]